MKTALARLMGHKAPTHPQTDNAQAIRSRHYQGSDAAARREARAEAKRTI